MATQLRAESVSALKAAGISDDVITKLASIQVPSMPGSTPINKLGFTSAQISKLPADCQHLTKDDLVSLGGWDGGGKLSAAASKLSTSDISAIRTVLGPSISSGPASMKLKMGDINCCCCPCCCATAVTAKKSIVKATAFVLN